MWELRRNRAGGKLKRDFIYYSMAIIAILLALTVLIFLKQRDPLPPATARLVEVLKHSKNIPQAELDSRISSEAVSFYQEGNTSVPKVLEAVSYLTGERSPAVAQTLTGLAKAGVSTSQLIYVAQQVGMNNQEVFVALVAGGVDPATITTGTAASGPQIISAGRDVSASNPSVTH